MNQTTEPTVTGPVTRASRLTPARRWTLVAGATVLLVGLPVVARSLPADDSDVSTKALLGDLRAGLDTPWSGYVETDGALQLPDADRFSDVGALFGEQSRLRVWWRGEDHWRVDRLTTAGEDDLVKNGETTIGWDYEGDQVSVSTDPEIRLPRTSDLVPSVLAERLVRGLDGGDVTRTDPRRVAGVSAVGLRLEPAAGVRELSSIDHASVWLDPDSGVALRVEVYSEGSTAPAFTSTVRDLDTGKPDGEAVSFTPPPGADVEYDDVLDIADAANQYAPLVPPDSAAGLPLSPTSDGAVGVYGEGMVQVIAIPLRDREADALREQLASTPGVEQDDQRTVVSVGPLGVLLTGGEGDGGFLLAGTLTRDALEQAGRDVLRGFRYDPRRDS